MMSNRCVVCDKSILSYSLSICRVCWDAVHPGVQKLITGLEREIYDLKSELSACTAKPEIIIGLTFYRQAEISNEDPWDYHADASGGIYDDFGELEDWKSDFSSVLPFEVSVTGGLYPTMDETFTDLMAGLEREVSMMVRGALDAFMHEPSRHWVDYWLAFESWFAAYPTDCGTEYDGGLAFAGIVTNLKVVVNP